LLVLGVLLAGCGRTLPAKEATATAHAEDDQAIRKLIADIQDAYNRHDAAGLMSYLAPDFTFGDVTSRARTLNRAVFAQQVAEEVVSSSKVRLDFKVLEIHFRGHDVAFVDLDHDFYGFVASDGVTARPPLFTRLVGTAVRTDGRWMLSDAREYRFPQQDK
jgi:uncharacterized protein (TIGR02246 family)